MPGTQQVPGKHLLTGTKLPDPGWGEKSSLEAGREQVILATFLDFAELVSVCTKRGRALTPPDYLT